MVPCRSRSEELFCAKQAEEALLAMRKMMTTMTASRAVEQEEFCCRFCFGRPKKNSVMKAIMAGSANDNPGNLFAYFHARDHCGPSVSPVRRRASMPAANSINLPKSQMRSESRLR